MYRVPCIGTLRRDTTRPSSHHHLLRRHAESFRPERPNAIVVCCRCYEVQGAEVRCVRRTISRAATTPVAARGIESWPSMQGEMEPAVAAAVAAASATSPQRPISSGGNGNTFVGHAQRPSTSANMRHTHTRTSSRLAEVASRGSDDEAGKTAVKVGTSCRIPRSNA